MVTDPHRNALPSVPRLLSVGVVAVSILLARVARASAQEPSHDRILPSHQTVISGYGTAGYSYRPQGDNRNEFTANINPIFLFQFLDRWLFEAELEFTIQQGITETGLEYAQLDFVATDNLTLVGGKFLLPFGVFSDRLHPTWINKFPTAPPIYGHHISEFGADPLLPVLSDVGVMARATVDPGPLNLSLNLYVTQGAAEEEGEDDIPGLEFPASSSDNNPNKMVGGRLDVALPPWAEVNFSFLNGDYDDNGVLDFTGWNIAAEVHYAGLEVRGEYLQTRQEIERFDGFPSLVRDCFYAQAAYRWRAWEPVFRWTQVFDDELDGNTVEEGAWQAGFGLDYWFSSTIAVMVGYELNRERGPEIDNDRIVAHIAFGF